MLVPVSIYRCVRVMGEWCPPGVILGSSICFQEYVRRGCGIQRTPGDKLTVETKIHKIYPRVRFYRGGGLFKAGVLSSVLYGTRYQLSRCDIYSHYIYPGTLLQTRVGVVDPSGFPGLSGSGSITPRPVFLPGFQKTAVNVFLLFGVHLYSCVHMYVYTCLKIINILALRKSYLVMAAGMDTCTSHCR